MNILGFRYLDCDEYHSSYSILEDKRYEKFTDKLSIHIFELPKVPKEIISGDTKQQWMELIRADSDEALEMVRTTSTSPEIQNYYNYFHSVNGCTLRDAHLFATNYYDWEDYLAELLEKIGF